MIAFSISWFSIACTIYVLLFIIGTNVDGLQVKDWRYWFLAISTVIMIHLARTLP